MTEFRSARTIITETLSVNGVEKSADLAATIMHALWSLGSYQIIGPVSPQGVTLTEGRSIDPDAALKFKPLCRWCGGSHDSDYCRRVRAFDLSPHGDIMRVEFFQVRLEEEL